MDESDVPAVLRIESLKAHGRELARRPVGVDGGRLVAVKALQGPGIEAGEAVTVRASPAQLPIVARHKRDVDARRRRGRRQRPRRDQQAAGPAICREPEVGDGEILRRQSLPGCRPAGWPGGCDIEAGLQRSDRLISRQSRNAILVGGALGFDRALPYPLAPGRGEGRGGFGG